MSRSRGRRLQHGRARAWISERLDGPLGPARDAALDAHLAACPDCRRVEEEYRANRAALRRLPAPAAPRDLPARTFAALEFEARRVGPARAAPVLQARGARRSGGVAIGSLLTVALVAVVGVLLAGPVAQIIPGPKAGATPFAITPVNLAYVGIEDQVVRLYHARLDVACPADTTTCPGFEPQADQVVNLPGISLEPPRSADSRSIRRAPARRSPPGRGPGRQPPSTSWTSAGLRRRVRVPQRARPPGLFPLRRPRAPCLPSAGPAPRQGRARRPAQAGAGATAGATRTLPAAGTQGSTATPRPSASASAEKTARATRAPTPRPGRSPAADASAGRVPRAGPVGQASAAPLSSAPAPPTGSAPTGAPATGATTSRRPSLRSRRAPRHLRRPSLR